MSIGAEAGQRLNNPKRITIGEKAVGPYDPNLPTGGGNFNPDMKIDTSHVSVAPPYFGKKMTVGEKAVPGSSVPVAHSVKSYFQQQALDRAVAQRRRGEQREAVRQLDRQRDDRERAIREREVEREVESYVQDWDREFMSGLQKGLRGSGITARWK
jgi:hypothetical protein